MAGGKSLRLMYVGHTTVVGSLRPIPDDGVLSTDFNQAENIGKHGRRWRRVLQQKSDTVQSPNGVFGRDDSITPTRYRLNTGDADERKPRAVRVGESENRLSKSPFQGIVPDTIFNQSLRPVTQCTQRNFKRRLMCQSGTTTSRCCVLPWEKGQDRARVAKFVTIVEVVSAGVVKIDRLLDQSQAKRATIEVQILRSLSGNGRDVVQA